MSAAEPWRCLVVLVVQVSMASELALALAPAVRPAFTLKARHD